MVSLGFVCHLSIKNRIIINVFYTKYSFCNIHFFGKERFDFLNLYHPTENQIRMYLKGNNAEGFPKTNLSPNLKRERERMSILHNYGMQNVKDD